jgi:hypothetical protein
MPIVYCPPEFATLRTWAGVIEKKPGVFYVGREPFLHSSRRRTDITEDVSESVMLTPRT